MSAQVTILLIAIAAGPGKTADPFTPAVARATRDALGSGTDVVVRQLEKLPSDGDAVSLAAQAHADAVVEVSWSLPDHLHTTIRMQRTGTARWMDRDIGFRDVDEPDERSRTVGFAIASMLPEYAARAEAAAPLVTPAAEAPKPASSGPEAGAPRAANPSSPPEPTPPKEERSPAPAEEDEASAPSSGPSPPPNGSSRISAGALAAFAIGDRGGAVGGFIDFRQRLSRTLSLRVGANGRTGFTPLASVNTRGFAGAAGVAWSAWVSSNQRASVGLRVDALMTVVEFRYQSATLATTEKEKALPGADVALEGSYFFAPWLGVVSAVGAEALFGQTNVFIDDQKKTSLGPVHPVVELGLRAAF